MATQPLGDQIRYIEENACEYAKHGRVAIPPARREHFCAFVGVVQDPLALAESRARHPSSGRGEESYHHRTARSCGSTSMTAADVPDAVRPVALGEVVDGVLHDPGQELLELGHAARVLEPDGVAALTDGPQPA